MDNKTPTERTLMPDVLIIGGGIAGISACAQLAPFAEVVLLEAEPESVSYTHLTLPTKA